MVVDWIRNSGVAVDDLACPARGSQKDCVLERRRNKEDCRPTVGMTPGGGQTKLPPTRTSSSDERIAAVGCQSHWATTFSGDFCTASSRYGGGDLGFVASLLEPEAAAAALAFDGGEVRVKPPGLGMPGTKTSSHCPGRNWRMRSCQWRGSSCAMERSCPLGDVGGEEKLLAMPTRRHAPSKPSARLGN